MKTGKQIEDWLLKSGYHFVDCTKCPQVKPGCYKQCKFYKSYTKNKNTEGINGSKSF